MAQPSIVPALQALLDRYVEQKEQDWTQHGKALPATNDGKIAATGVIDEMKAMGLKLGNGAGRSDGRSLASHHVQHLHRKPELVVKLNALGRKQGLKPLGSRAQADTNDLWVVLVEVLDRLQAAYLRQPEGKRNATLPLNPAGKVSLADMAGLLAEQLPGLERPVIFRGLHQEELTSEIGLVADRQGVCLPDEALSPGDEALRQRMVQQAKIAANDARAAAGARLAEARLREELAAAQTTIQRLQAQIESLHAQIGLMHSGIAIRGLQ